MSHENKLKLVKHSVLVVLGDLVPIGITLLFIYTMSGIVGYLSMYDAGVNHSPIPEWWMHSAIGIVALFAVSIAILLMWLYKESVVERAKVRNND